MCPAVRFAKLRDRCLNINETEETLERISRLVSARFGPILNSHVRVLSNSSPALYVSGAGIAIGDAFGGGDFRGGAGAGDDYSPARALLYSLAEAAERYGACLTPSRTRFRMTSYRDLAREGDVLDLEDYQILREGVDARRFRRLLETDVVPWFEGIEMTGADERSIWYPGPFLMLAGAQARPFNITTTSGFGLGSSPEQAIVSATCELLERDAFMSAWLKKEAWPSYPLSEVEDLLDPRLRHALRSVRTEARLVDFTGKWNLPCFLIAFEGEKAEGKAYVTVGSAAGLDALSALTRAVWEALRIFITMCGRIKAAPDVQLPDPPFEDSIFNFDDIRLLCRDPRLKGYHRFLFGERQFDAEGLRAKIRSDRFAHDRARHVVELKRRIEEKGARAFLFDMTPLDLAKESLFLYRVCSPDVVPLNCAHAVRALGAKPLRSMALEDLNQDPHPYL